MSSVNKVTLVGNLGKDPEVRRMQSGDAVVNFSLATTESWRDKTTGDRKDKTEWHSVVIFNDGLAKVAESYLRKGSKVYIEGQLQTREWEQDGQKRRATEIVLQKYRGELVLLDGKRDDQNASPSPSKPSPAPDSYAAARGMTGKPASRVIDDTDLIPF